MGGYACIVVIHAKVRYDAVPSNQKDQRELEAQLRDCFGTSTIAEAVAAQGEAQAKTVWDILAKPGDMTAVDMGTLMESLDGIYT